MVASLHPAISLLQTNSIRGASTASACLSLIGSSLLIYQIVVGKKLGSPLHRLLLGMSIMDMIASLRMSIWPLAFWPIEEPSAVCTADGFLTMVGLGAPYYNGAISCYYVLAIRYSVREEVIAKYYEPIMHMVVVSYTLICACVGLGYQAYNPTTTGLNCWLSPWPQDCLSNPDIECETGDTPFGWTPAFTAIIVLFMLIINNALIYRFVRKTHLQTLQYTTNHQGASGAVLAPSSFLSSSFLFSSKRSSSVTATTRRSASTNTTNEPNISQKVAVQSFLYVSAFFVSYIWSLIATVLFSVDPVGATEGKFYSLTLLEAIFLPLQGALNLLVFVRPRYLRWRKYHTRWYSFQKAIFSMDNPKPRRGSVTAETSGQAKRGSTPWSLRYKLWGPSKTDTEELESSRLTTTSLVVDRLRDNLLQSLGDEIDNRKLRSSNPPSSAVPSLFEEEHEESDEESEEAELHSQENGGSKDEGPLPQSTKEVTNDNEETNAQSARCSGGDMEEALDNNCDTNAAGHAVDEEAGLDTKPPKAYPPPNGGELHNSVPRSSLAANEEATAPRFEDEPDPGSPTDPKEENQHEPSDLEGGLVRLPKA